MPPHPTKPTISALRATTPYSLSRHPRRLRRAKPPSRPTRRAPSSPLGSTSPPPPPSRSRSRPRPAAGARAASAGPTRASCAASRPAPAQSRSHADAYRTSRARQSPVHRPHPRQGTQTRPLPSRLHREYRRRRIAHQTLNFTIVTRCARQQPEAPVTAACTCVLSSSSTGTCRPWIAHLHYRHSEHSDRGPGTVLRCAEAGL